MLARLFAQGAEQPEDDLAAILLNLNASPGLHTRCRPYD
jgi:hypothetical protein